jgi:acyl carrier protein
MSPVLDQFSGFCDFVSDATGVDVSHASSSDTIVQLGLDSVALLELLASLHDLGIAFPEQLMDSVETIGDLHYYAVTVQNPGGRDEHR